MVAMVITTGIMGIIINQILILLKRQVTNPNVIKKAIIPITHWVTTQAIKLITTKDNLSSLISIQLQIKSVPTAQFINTGLNTETTHTIVVASLKNL